MRWTGSSAFPQLRYRHLAKAPGAHLVVLDQPSPAPAARPGLEARFDWLANRETIWYRVYKEAYEEGWVFPMAQRNNVGPMRLDGFYPSVVVSHAKFNPLLEIADAVVGLSLDFAYYNLARSMAGQLPDLDWQDEQFIQVVKKFRADPRSGAILNWGYALFPRRAPAS
jgi:hypothetical protein